MTTKQRAILFSLGLVAIGVFVILGYLLIANKQANDDLNNLPTTVARQPTINESAESVPTVTSNPGSPTPEPTPTTPPTETALPEESSVTATPSPTPPPTLPPTTFTPTIAENSPPTPTVTLTPTLPPPTPTFTPTPYGYDPTWVSPWGVQTWDYSLLGKTAALKMRWIRVPVFWAKIQPTQQDGEYNWAEMDDMMGKIAATNLQPILTVHTNPPWADRDGNLCGPLKDNQYLADFLSALVKRYSAPPYNVKHWEIGNEIDVRYSTWLQIYAPGNNGGIGCWGDIAPQYVEFLRVASETIRSIEPDAVILMGALSLLDSTNMNLLNEVLAAGGAPYFDMIGVNFYYGQDQAWYTCADPDRSEGHICQSVMGMRGKARIVHDMLAQHSVDKRVMITETAFRCLHAWPNWEPCTPDELQAAAAYVVKTHVWALAENAYPIIWFTLDYPGFWHSSLLDKAGNPKPVYRAYQTMADELHWARYVQPMTAEELGDDRLEGYLFRVGERKKWVLWAKGDISLPVRFPASEQPGGELRVVDVYGTARLLSDATDAQPADGLISLEVNSNPVYVSQVP